MRLYVSLVHPHLEYCSIVWDPSSTSLSHSLECVQRFALKLACKFRSSLIYDGPEESSTSTLFYTMAQRGRPLPLYFTSNFLFRLLTSTSNFHSTEIPLQTSTLDLRTGLRLCTAHAQSHVSAFTACNSTQPLASFCCMTHSFWCCTASTCTVVSFYCLAHL